MNVKRFLVPILFLVSCCLMPMLKAEEAANSPGELNLPWAEFQKLLNSNRNQIVLSWDDFQTLMKQTGATANPNSVQNGQVVLSREEFKNILSRMAPAPSQAAKYFLTKAVYSGRVGRDSTLVKATFQLQVLGKVSERFPVRVPLFPGLMAFQDVLMDEKPAVVEHDGSQLLVIVSQPGEHTITARFSVASSLKKAPAQLSFSIPQTPVTQLSLVIPLKNVDVNVQSASEVSKEATAEGTLVRALLPVSSSIYVSWNSVMPEAEKGPAKVYAEVFNLLTIEDDALKLKTAVELDILQNTVNTVNIQLPEGYSVLDVQGDAIGDWTVKGTDARVLVVPFSYAKSGKTSFVINAEQLFKDKNVTTGFDGVHVLKSIREKGFVGVELKTTAEAKAEVEGLDRMDAQEAPSSLVNLASRPLLYTYKYLRQPYSLTLDIQRHEEVAVVSTVVDEANGVSMILEDGQRVHNLTFRIRNSWKQFIELSLPDKAQVWSTFVEGQRVRPSKNEQGRVLIPLNRSQNQNGNLNGFDVEIMYYEAKPTLPLVGKAELIFPMPDVVVSQLLWSVYLPANHDYLSFGGDVDSDEQASGVKPVLQVLLGGQSIISNVEKQAVAEYYSMSGPVSSQSGATGGYEDSQRESNRRSKVKETTAWKTRGRFSETKNVAEDSYLRQMDQEFKFFNQVRSQSLVPGPATGDNAGAAGVLPIRIKVPQVGKVFRFTKQLVVNQSALHLRVSHLHHGFVQALFVLLWILFIGLLVRYWSILKPLLMKAKILNMPTSFGWRTLVSPVGFAIVATVAMVVIHPFVNELRFLIELIFVIALIRLGIVWAIRWFKAIRSPKPDDPSNL